MSENDSGNDDIMGPGVWSDEEEIDLDHDEFEEGTAPDAADNTDPKIERSRENERQRRWLNKLMKSAEKAAQRYQGIQLFMFGLSGYSTLLSKRAFKSVGIGSHMRAIHDGVCSQVKKLYLIHAGKKEALSSMDDVQLGKWKSIVKPGIDMAYEKGIFSSSQVEAFWNMVNDVNLGKNHKDEKSRRKSHERLQRMLAKKNAECEAGRHEVITQDYEEVGEQGGAEESEYGDGEASRPGKRKRKVTSKMGELKKQGA